MKFPVQIQFRDIAESDFVYNDIWSHAQKLSRFFDRIVSCHVVISSPHHHHHKGRVYHLAVRLYLPGGDVYVNTEHEKNHAHEDAYVAVKDAFRSVRRRLEDFVRMERGMVKAKASPDEDIAELVFNEGR